MVCIFCDKENEAGSIEHIVSESFGNKRYLMARGAVCDQCNNKFAAFEKKALSNTVFLMERARFGIGNKRGKNAKGEIGDLEIMGHEDLEKQKITIKGLSEKNFKLIDPQNGIGHLIVQSFDKSEVATSRLLLKIGLESIFTSQKGLFKKYNFQELKDYLSGQTNTDWPFLTTHIQQGKFQSIPKYYDKYALKQIKCQLEFYEFDGDTLLFRFSYGAITMVINLVDRNAEWVKIYSGADQKSRLYPEHFRKKFDVSNGSEDHA
ncbi:HNH endonuclease [Pedobacter sp. B4-66]|uniref:HNH endonuclease n=1 Tax=Pedobacter sp. B4-66 TaxID=2817280 RepID=UPI001BD93D40|nr:HNH endonuclease [Pedobacter sp. B4-66]